MKKNENNPLISIIMAEYNTDINQFNESINSLLSQTYNNFEILIVDDCGKNNVEELLKEYKDNRIKIIKNSNNIGLAKSLNKAIKNSKSKYILRMDTDDIALPNRIERQVQFILKHPEYSIVGTRHTTFNENGEFAISKFKGEIYKNQFLKGTPFCHPSLLIVKSCLEKIGGYPNFNRGQDYAMEMEMYCHGYKGYIMDEVLLKYRQDKNSFKKRKFKDRIAEYKMRKKYFKKLKLPWYRMFYTVKPIVSGIIPKNIMKIYHGNK